MALQYRTVVGKYTDTAGNPVSGYIEFTPTNKLVHTYNAILPVSNVQAKLDDDGRFSVNLLCTDNVEIREKGWLWFVEEKVENPSFFYIQVPYDPAELDIADIYMTNVVGPYYGVVGPPGPTAVSSDAGNASVLGSDGFIFTPTSELVGGVYVQPGGPGVVTDLVWVDIDDLSISGSVPGSESPLTAPYRPAYARDGDSGLYYKLSDGINEVLILDVEEPVPPNTPADTFIVRIVRS